MIKATPWVFYALLSAFFAALTAVFAKAGLKNVNSDLATAIRTAVVLLLVWGIAIYKNNIKELPGLTFNDWIFLILSAFATGLSWLFYYRALQLGRVAEVSAIDKGSLVFAILLSYFFLGEPITAKILLGGSLIVGGMLVLVWK
jgi:bacterial/archaeal transporter family protein